MPLALALLILSGCGGHGGSSSSSSSAATTSVGKGPGRAVLKVLWPARPNARLIPNAANSIVVSLLQGATVVASATIPRPAAGGTSASATLTGLAYGTYGVRVGAFPGTDGSGVSQAGGAGTMTVTEDAPGSLTVAMGSTVAHLAISPASTLVPVGVSTTLTASATDASGAIVLLAAGGGSEGVAWTVGDPGVATITTGAPTATLKGVGVGMTTVTATLKVKDDGTTVQATSAIEAQNYTLSVSANDAGFVYGSTVQTRSDSLPTPAMTVSAILDPTRPTPTDVVFSAVGPISFSFGTARTIPANGSTAGTLVNPSHVNADTLATLIVTAGSLTGTATVLVKANPLASATGPASVASGAVGTATVTLGLYAVDAETVALACDDPTVTLPASVTVPRPIRTGGSGQHGIWTGTKTANFAFTAPTVTTARDVTITATRAGVSKSFTFTITP